jgi:uncharacterized protein YeaO (DUF488 family)
MLRLKRAYDSPASEDGARFLVDRLWPRGMKKEALSLRAWTKDVAPTDSLRRWFGHDPKKWEGFRRRYFAELDANAVAWEPILKAARDGDVTLVYSAHDTEHNNAVALRDYLEAKMTGKPRRRSTPARASTARQAH